MFVVTVLVAAICFRIALSLAKIKASPLAVINISGATVFVTLIPVIGVPLSMLTMLLLIRIFTNTGFWPRGVLATAITFALLRGTVLLGRYLIGA